MTDSELPDDAEDEQNRESRVPAQANDGSEEPEAVTLGTALDYHTLELAANDASAATIISHRRTVKRFNDWAAKVEGVTDTSEITSDHFVAYRRKQLGDFADETVIDHLMKLRSFIQNIEKRSACNKNLSESLDPGQL